MLDLHRGRWIVRMARDAADLHRAQQLRGLCFARPGPAAADEVDSDSHDARCSHVLVEDRRSGALVCCFRLLSLESGRGIGTSYAAQHYDLSLLGGHGGRMIEIGRFCIHPDWRHPDIPRIAWAALAAHVEAEGVELLFGCSSFAGIDPARHRDAFAMLASRHLAPSRWRPGARAADVFRFAQRLPGVVPDTRAAQAAMPPLLRSYLLMGGWVSDHAVVDHDLGTLHVFTGLEVAAIPPARRRLLAALAH